MRWMTIANNRWLKCENCKGLNVCGYIKILGCIDLWLCLIAHIYMACSHTIVYFDSRKHSDHCNVRILAMGNDPQRTFTKSKIIIAIRNHYFCSLCCALVFIKKNTGGSCPLCTVWLFRENAILKLPDQLFRLLLMILLGIGKWHSMWFILLYYYCICIQEGCNVFAVLYLNCGTWKCNRSRVVQVSFRWCQKCTDLENCNALVPSTNEVSHSFIRKYAFRTRCTILKLERCCAHIVCLSSTYSDLRHACDEHEIQCNPAPANTSQNDSNLISANNNK